MDDKVNEKPGVLLYTAVTLKACSFVHAKKKKKARSIQFSTPSIIQTYTLVSTIVLHTLLSSSCRLASHKAETLVKIDTYLLDLMQVRPTVGCA